VFFRRAKSVVKLYICPYKDYEAGWRKHLYRVVEMNDFTNSVKRNQIPLEQWTFKVHCWVVEK